MLPSRQAGRAILPDAACRHKKGTIRRSVPSVFHKTAWLRRDRSRVAGDAFSRRLILRRVVSRSRFAPTRSGWLAQRTQFLQAAAWRRAWQVRERRTSSAALSLLSGSGIATSFWARSVVWRCGFSRGCRRFVRLGGFCSSRRLCGLHRALRFSRFRMRRHVRRRDWNLRLASAVSNSGGALGA